MGLKSKSLFLLRHENSFIEDVEADKDRGQRFFRGEKDATKNKIQSGLGD